MSSSRVKPGDVLGGKYRVERVLGTGGMGIVVAAKHLDLNQRVALKFMLKEAMASPDHAERFLREAKAAVQLKSLHTAKVLDVGKLQNGEPFMVMEYLDGHDLDAEMRRAGPQSPHTAVEYILQASEALAEAHGLGMVHRDVKLKNLFLTKKVDGRPLVKVLDFGLAKQLGAGGDVSLTATNSVFGSPQYMSPEQMRSAKDVDFRSDIWSLGVCLYELLTGRVPFDAQGVAEICAMVLKDPVPRPSQFVHGLPIDLEAVIMKCLEKDLSRRYQSVAELAFALQGYTADEGSARRILTVMQTSASSKADHATLVSPEPPVDGVGKTLNAWDSGSPRRTTSLPRSIAIITAVFVGLGLAGALLTGLVLYKKPRPPPAVVATATVDPIPPTSSAEPPPPESTIPAPATATPTPEPPATEPTPEPPSSKNPTVNVTPPPPAPATGPRAHPATAHPPVAGPKPTSPSPAPPASGKKGTPKMGEGGNYM